MEESNNNIETKKIVTCRNCGTILRDDALFCHECGQSKDGPWFCYNCKSVLQENQKFCPSCGVMVGPEGYKKRNKFKPLEGNLKALYVEDQKMANKNVNELKKQALGNKQKNCLILSIVFTFLQLLLFGGDVFVIEASAFGVGGSSAAKFSDMFDYPSLFFYISLIFNIAMYITLIIYKNNIHNKPKLRFAPCVINLIMPLIMIIKFIDSNNNSGLAETIFSSLGGNVNVSITFGFIILVISVIASEVFSLINALTFSE